MVGELLHLFCSDLNFDGQTVHSKQCRVEGLVTVGFGNRDVIFESTRHGLIQVVHHAEHPITRIDVLYDDSEGVNIHDFGERAALRAHLGVDAVEMFFSPKDASRNPFGFQASSDGILQFGDHLFPIATSLTHCFFNHA